MKSHGFTLLELLLAATILAIIGTFTWSSLGATFRAREAVEHATDLQDAGTAILYKMREDISQAYHVDAFRPLTFFKGEDRFNEDRLTFTSLSHSALSRNAHECDQTEITYQVESHPETQGVFLLQRRESSWVDGNTTEGGSFVTLADNLLSFNLQYFRNDQFVDSWDIQSSEAQNKLPALVRVQFRLRDKNGTEESFSTIVDIPLSQGLNLAGATTIPQSGASNPGAGPNPQGGARNPAAPRSPGVPAANPAFGGGTQ